MSVEPSNGDGGGMNPIAIEARGLAKTYGSTTAVDSVDFTVRPGLVTGFLGPNGAGKSTTMRMVLGLDRPSAGAVTVGGRDYREIGAPLRTVGALLDAHAVHPGRTARDHLRWLAASNSIPRRRVDDVLGLVGLQSAAGVRAGKYSLGMGQRLGIAAALLGDPAVVVLDEPVNGLDPEGIRWIRSLMRQLADEGRTVFVSSHLMSEMALTADHLLVIGRGSILADTSMTEFINCYARTHVRVRAPRAGELADLLRREGLELAPADTARDEIQVLTDSTAAVGDLAGAAGLRLHELTLVRSSLEDAFMSLTAASVEFSTQSPTGPSAGPPAHLTATPAAPPESVRSITQGDAA
jgi:ABC-2 type transport system ATP-binding protein